MLNFILKPTSAGEVERETTAGLLLGGLHIVWSTSHLARGGLCYNQTPSLQRAWVHWETGLEATTAAQVTLAGASRLQ